MQLPMNFETSQSSRATNIVQPECNPANTPIPHMTNYVPPTYTPIPPMTNYDSLSASNMDYTPPIVQPDDFLSNVFGTDFVELILARQHQLVNTCIAYKTKWNQVSTLCLARMYKTIIHHCLTYQMNTHVEIQDVTRDALHVEQDTIIGIK